jgi:hypothetical protein
MLDDRGIGHLRSCRCLDDAEAIVKKDLQRYCAWNVAESDFKGLDELGEKVVRPRTE